ncbi:NfeD family protein [Chloroflexota bacterium]
MKRTIKDWLIVLASLLDEAAVVLLILLVLWFLKIPISLPVIIFLALFIVAFAFIMHKAVIPALHRKKTTGAEGMKGLTGEVIEPLVPVGVIRVGAEYWKAKSVEGAIETGEEVEILSVDGLTLMVRHKHQ